MWSGAWKPCCAWRVAIRSSSRDLCGHAVTTWAYDGSTLWSYDDPQTLRAKMDYVRDKDLCGAMAWE